MSCCSPFLLAKWIKMILEKRIAEIIEPSIEDMGFELVRAIMVNQGAGQALQVMIERKDGAELTVDHCADVSHTVSALLDVDDPIPGEYTLEVSSPGIDRPLTRKKDFENYAGYEAKIELESPLDGRRRYRGVLKGVNGDDVEIKVDGTVYSVPFAMIGTSKLVMSDKLIKRLAGAKSN